MKTSVTYNSNLWATTIFHANCGGTGMSVLKGIDELCGDIDLV